jgi:hypothetical protein
MGPIGPDSNRRPFVLVLGEWAERYALSPLNVTGAPVVCQDVSEYPPPGLLGGHGPANFCTAPAPAAPAAAADMLDVCASADHKGHLQLKIDQPCWAVLAPFLGIGGVDHDLAARTAQPP